LEWGVGMLAIGIDVGTRFVKGCAVIDNKITSPICVDIGVDLKKSIKNVIKEICANTGTSIFTRKVVYATGYGSNLVASANRTVNIGSCLSKAVYTLNKDVRTIIDVGGLFINVLTIYSDGQLKNSVEVEKCAAGSGKFLETISKAVEIPFEGISHAVEQSKNPYNISSGCAVFAESEVITNVNQGACNYDIVSGVLRSIVSKTITLVHRVGSEGRISLVGGVGKIPAFQKILADELNSELIILPVDMQIIAAYGAAIMASEA